ncbi:hypothetical protein AURANDRAFT_33123, partial [Aureococcus anophagefferens]
GEPLENVLCYVVDPEINSLLPIGIYGELWIGGVQVARGYLNRPELTAERFVPSPWSTIELGRGIVYRSGDSVRWCIDGELEFAGRIDF